MDGLCKCCHGLFRKFIGKGMQKSAFIWGMRVFVCFLNACPIYVMNYEMIEYMDNYMDKFLYKLLLNFTIVMALLSYWTACLKSPKPIPLVSI